VYATTQQASDPLAARARVGFCPQLWGDPFTQAVDHTVPRKSCDLAW